MRLTKEYLKRLIREQLEDLESSNLESLPEFQGLNTLTIYQRVTSPAHYKSQQVNQTDDFSDSKQSINRGLVPQQDQFIMTEVELQELTPVVQKYIEMRDSYLSKRKAYVDGYGEIELNPTNVLNVLLYNEVVSGKLKEAQKNLDPLPNRMQYTFRDLYFDREQGNQLYNELVNLSKETNLK